MVSAAVFLILALVPLSLQQYSSSEYSGYSETCGGRRPCNSKKNLACGQYDTCECLSGYVHVISGEGCLLPPTESNEWRCSEDSLCRSSELGQFSKCDRGSCACLPDVEIRGQWEREEVFRNGNKCYYVNNAREKCITETECYLDLNFGSEQCTHDHECHKTHGLSSTCDNRSCRCTEGARLFSNLCYEPRKLGQPCQEDGQCEAGVGPGTFCHTSSGVCARESQQGSSASTPSKAAVAFLSILFSIGQILPA